MKLSNSLRRKKPQSSKPPGPPNPARRQAPDRTKLNPISRPRPPRSSRVTRPETAQANVPRRRPKAKKSRHLPPLSSARESAEAIDHGHNQPTRQLAMPSVPAYRSDPHQLSNPFSRKFIVPSHAGLAERAVSRKKKRWRQDLRKRRAAARTEAAAVGSTPTFAAWPMNPSSSAREFRRAYALRCGH
jgi:hypothetical protein